MTDSDSVERAADMEPPPRYRPASNAVSYWLGPWDWGSSAYSAVITSFVFGPYVVRGVVGDAEPGGLTANTWLGISTAVAGLLVAAIAPITGQRADASGHRKRSLAIWSGLVIAVMLGMFSVKDDPSYLWLALVLLAAGAVFQEFAVVSYNAMLPQVSTPDTIGRVSGFGWAMGYFGGIFLLLILLRRIHRPGCRLVRGEFSRWPQHPCCRGLLGRLVCGFRDSGAAGGTRVAAWSQAPAGELLRRTGC